MKALDVYVSFDSIAGASDPFNNWRKIAAIGSCRVVDNAAICDVWNSTYLDSNKIFKTFLEISKACLGTLVERHYRLVNIFLCYYHPTFRIRQQISHKGLLVVLLLVVVSFLFAIFFLLLLSLSFSFPFLYFIFL